MAGGEGREGGKAVLSKRNYHLYHLSQRKARFQAEFERWGLGTNLHPWAVEGILLDPLTAGVANGATR